MQNIVDDLGKGNYRQVMEKALEKWRQFAASVRSSSEIIVVDSCLFGYLTWSLFPFSVPEREIRQYVREVGRTIEPLNPHVIYLYQNDVGAALRNICVRRGGDTEKNFVRAAVESPYGKSRGLNGFEGMVTYWKDYRSLTDQAFQDLNCPKIAVENSGRKWSLYRRNVLDFLGLEQDDQASFDPSRFRRLVGTYVAETEDGATCTVQIESGHLIADGIPQVWAKSVLLPRSPNTFDVQSLPFQVDFVEKAEDATIRLHVNGPALLNGPVEYCFVKSRQPYG